MDFGVGVQIYTLKHLFTTYGGPKKIQTRPKISTNWDKDVSLGWSGYQFTYIAFINYRHWVFSPDVPLKKPLKYAKRCTLYIFADYMPIFGPSSDLQMW